MTQPREYVVNICPRVRMRMTCIEGTCSYPDSESAMPTDPSVPHFDEEMLQSYLCDHGWSGSMKTLTKELMTALGIARQA